VSRVVDLRRGIYRRLYSGVRTGRRLNACSVDAELLFWRLHAAADDFGNLHGEPELCRIDAAPLRREWDNGRVADLLDELAGTDPPLIRFYTVDDERFVHICEFCDRQPANRDGRRYQRYPPDPFTPDELNNAAESCGAVRTDTESQSRSGPDPEIKSQNGPDAGPQADGKGPGPDRQACASMSGTGAGPGKYRGKADAKAWTQLVMIELCEALGLDGNRAIQQRDAMRAVIRRFRDHPDRDDVAADVIACAADKRGAPDIDYPVKAWQAEMNRRFPR